MCNEDHKALILHNTYRIIAANSAACAMFRCDESDLIDLDMIQIVADESMQGLARLRLNVMRNKELREQELPIYRPDNSIFLAVVKSRRIDDHTFESELRFLYDLP